MSSAKAGMTSKEVRLKKKRRKAKEGISSPQRRKGKKKTAKKKAKKKRKARPPVDEAEVRRLGLECENLTEADAAIRTRKSLKQIFRKHPEIRQAWERGRFLRNLRDLARTGVSVTEASKKLGLASGRTLRDMLDNDTEAGDLWNQTRLQIYVDIKSALIEAAKEGRADAVRAVDNFLMEEKDRPAFDPSRVTILQLTEITGKARQRIHEWYTRFGLPRNPDKTFDLSIFLAWFEDFLIKKSSTEKESAAVLDPLKRVKAEKLKMELASHRNELLDRNEVIIGQVAWIQHLISLCDRGVEELSRLCYGQPREKIEEIHRGFFRDLHSEAVNIPKEIRLPAAPGRKLKKILMELKPSDDTGKISHNI
jgi:hypothetical protein